MKRLHAKAVQAVKALPHPKDRKVDQLQRKLRRDVRIDQQKDHLNTKQALVASRFYWFREQVSAIKEQDATRVEFSPSEVAALTQLNIDRNQAEVQELKGLRNPPVGRIKHLTNLRQIEMDQFASAKGITVPDISTADSVEVLLDIWDGDARTIACVPTQQCSRIGCDMDDALQKFSGEIKSSDDVREAQMSVHAPSKLRRFVAEGNVAKARNTTATAVDQRKKSVKASKSASEIAISGKNRRVLQQQTQAKVRRQAAITASRGLMQK